MDEQNDNELTATVDLQARWHTALQQLQEALDTQKVCQELSTLNRYASSTSARSTLPLGVVYPGNSDDVVAVTKIACANRIPVYPISTGKNWGYGDACAVSSGQLIMDLSRMNRILQVDAELAYAVIEPGVTQIQLAQYLSEHHSGLWIDCTGAGPDTSFVGNILERGFGHSPYGNRLQNTAGMQIVLADGAILDTGFGHYPNAKATHLFAYGIGPFLDGLFTQSNFGIVTKLGIWLMPAAPCIQHFICSVPLHEQVGAVVDALRPLRLNGTLRSVVHIGNDLRVISGGQTFPQALTAALSLPQDVRSSLRARAAIGAWTVSGAIYGDARQVGAARHLLRKAISPTGASIQFITERKLAIGAFLARLLDGTAAGRRLSQKVLLGRVLFGMNKGIPSGRFLAGAYWRKRGGLPAGFPENANPANDNCGLLWLSPILPMRGASLLAIHAMVEPVFAAFSFDMFVTFNMVNDRALGAIFTIAFDKEDGAEVGRAKQCYKTLFDLLMKTGYIPYRVGQQSMDDLDAGDDVFWSTVRKIKHALDPLSIIAPGRYLPVARERVAEPTATAPRKPD